jgi:hypothetical protein
MPKIDWKQFDVKYQNPYGFAAIVSATLPKGPYFDKSRNKLPTPYRLFQEWASASLSGDWSSLKLQGGFIICVDSESDVALINKKFGVIGSAKKTPACANTLQVNYKDSDYAYLAKEIGYDL